MIRMKIIVTGLLWLGLFLGVFFRVPLIEFSQPHLEKGQVFIARVLHGPGLLYPNKQEDLSAFSVVGDQWGSDDFRYVVVVEANTPVMYKPDARVKPRSRLDVSKRVCVLFKMKGWAFVGEPDYSEAIGWVSDEALGFKSDFSAIEMWEYGDVKMMNNSVTGTYEIKEFGHFSYAWRAYGGGLILKGDTTGQFMRCKAVIWAQKETTLVWEDFFFLDDEDFLYPEIMVNPGRRAI